VNTHPLDIFPFVLQENLQNSRKNSAVVFDLLILCRYYWFTFQLITMLFDIKLCSRSFCSDVVLLTFFWKNVLLTFVVTASNRAVVLSVQWDTTVLMAKRSYVFSSCLCLFFSFFPTAPFIYFTKHDPYTSLGSMIQVVFFRMCIVHQRKHSKLQIDSYEATFLV